MLYLFSGTGRGEGTMSHVGVLFTRTNKISYAKNFLIRNTTYSTYYACIEAIIGLFLPKRALSYSNQSGTFPEEKNKGISHNTIQK